MDRISTFTRTLLGGLTLLGLLSLAPVVQAAAITDASGTLCKNYNAGQVTFIDYLVDGTRNLASYAVPVICPVARNTSDTNGATVFVNLTTFSAQTTSCTAYSYDFTGAFLGSASGSSTGTGFQTIGLNLSGAGKSTVWSNYSVLCTIAGNGQALIYDVDLSEN